MVMLRLSVVSVRKNQRKWQSPEISTFLLFTSVKCKADHVCAYNVSLLTLVERTCSALLTLVERIKRASSALLTFRNVGKNQ